MDPEIQKQMGAMRVMRQQQQNCMAKVQALKQTQKRIELTQKEISTVSLFLTFDFEVFSKFHLILINKQFHKTNGCWAFI